MKPPAKSQFPILYNSMRNAIDACHRIDECKDMIDRSAALATYYAQIHDDDSLRKINDIRFRGWRRMGDILRTVDISKCTTQAQTAKACRAEIDAAKMLTDHYINRSLKLAAMPPPDFEKAIQATLPSGSVDRLIRADPAYQKEQAVREAKYKRERAEQERKWRERQEEEERKRAAQRAKEAKRAERAPKLVRVQFWLKPVVRNRLQESAKTHSTSVREIIRRGMNLWLEQHGEPQIPGGAFSTMEQD